MTDRERRKIAHHVQSLAAEPRPHGVEKLTGQERYRVRQGEYRVLYEIDDASREVTVVKIADGERDGRPRSSLIRIRVTVRRAPSGTPNAMPPRRRVDQRGPENLHLLMLSSLPLMSTWRSLPR